MKPEKLIEFIAGLQQRLQDIPEQERESATIEAMIVNGEIVFKIIY